MDNNLSMLNYDNLKYHGNLEKPDIKIFVSHRIDMDTSTFNSSILIPVRCGAIYDERQNCCILGDNTGDNISEKRFSFCENTVLYWAWKNIKADYFGLFHYRRFLNFSHFQYPEDELAYVVDEYINDDTARTYGLNDSTMQNLIQKYDIILPKYRDVTKLPGNSKSLWEQWNSASYLHDSDLKTLVDIIKRIYPEYYAAAVEYLNGKYAYYCSMFIMKNVFFQEYCNWLFPILFTAEKEIDVSNYTQEGQRLMGHFAERLLGIYITYLKKNRNISICELQTVLFTKPKLEKLKLFPAFSKLEKTVPIVFSSSQLFIPICSVALSSVVENASCDRFYDIVIIESNISKKSKEIILRFFQKRKNISIRFINVYPIIKKYNLQPNNHISIETYYRFIIQEILPDYNKVLYLDSDIVCDSDVSNLFDIDISKFILGATYDPDMCGQLHLADSDMLRYLSRDVGLKDPFSYFQAGVLLLNLEEMRKTHTVKEWLEYCQTPYKYMDQDVLNKYCQGKVLYFDMSWNTLIDCNNYRVPVIISSATGEIYRNYLLARKNPKIIHFAGCQKPWNEVSVDFEEFFWKYARKSPFYEQIVFSLYSKNQDHAVSVSETPPIGVRGAMKIFIRKKAKKLFPRGTRRRKVLFALFGRWIRN